MKSKHNTINNYFHLNHTESMKNMWNPPEAGKMTKKESIECTQSPFFIIFPPCSAGWKEGRNESNAFSSYIIHHMRLNITEDISSWWAGSFILQSICLRMNCPLKEPDGKSGPKNRRQCFLNTDQMFLPSFYHFFGWNIIGEWNNSSRLPLISPETAAGPRM